MLSSKRTLACVFCALGHTVMMSASNADSSFYDQKEKGWLFYKEAPSRPNDHREHVHEQKTTSTTPSQSKIALQKIKRIQQQFEEATAMALLSPTPQNVQKVMRLQRQILNRASTFSERWMDVSLSEERFNRPEDNGAPLHRKVMRDSDDKHLTAQIKQLAKHMGLFFVFKSNCSYCHEYAPAIQEFAQEYGFALEAISADGGTLKEFPKPLMDNGALRTLNPQGYYPALFLAHPGSNQFWPLAYGITSPSELRQRLHLILRNLEKGRFLDAP